MVQRQSAERSSGGKRTQRPETRLSRQASDNAKRRKVGGSVDTSLHEQAADPSRSSRRRSARESTRKQTAAADLTAAVRPPTTERRPSRATQSDEAKAAAQPAHGPAIRSRPVTQATQQQGQPCSKTSSEPLSTETDDRGVNLHSRTLPPVKPAVRQSNISHTGLVPATKAHRVSWNLQQAASDTDSKPSGSAANQKGKRKASVLEKSASQPDESPPADSGPSALNAEPAGPSTIPNMVTISEPAQLPSIHQTQDVDPDATAKHAQHSNAHMDRQPAASKAIGDAKAQDQPPSKPKRKHCQGTPHPTFKGVKTTTAGATKFISHPDVKQIWSAFVSVPSHRGKHLTKLLFLGKNYWTAEAAARAVDRANIAFHGRDGASTNFPLEWYGPEEVQRHGEQLKMWLKSLAGNRNNNPANVPGVPYIKYTRNDIASWNLAHPKGSVERTRKYQKGKAPEKAPARPTIDAGFCRQLWERLTGASADSAPTKGQALQGLKVPWLKKRCGLCANCKKANAGFGDKQRGVDMCLVLPKLQTAKKELFRLAKESNQQRFAPADLDEFLASLPDPTRNDPTATLREHGRVDERLQSRVDDSGEGGQQEASNLKDGLQPGVKPEKGLRPMADLSEVPREQRGGARVKGFKKGVRAKLQSRQWGALTDGQDHVMSEASPSADAQTEGQLPLKLGRGRSQGTSKKKQGVLAEHAVNWADAQVSALQAREAMLYNAQEQARVLAADAAPFQGSYQPLLAAAPPAVSHQERLKWPPHHAVDIRHIDRSAKEGKLVEICNHGWWGQPALGALGPPAASLQGSLGPHPGRQQARVGCCHWCKAGDHLVKDCPLNEYFGEQPSKSVQQELQQPAKQKGRAAKVSHSKAGPSQKAASAEWLSQVSKPVKGVMSAMQQMASVAVQSNEQTDSSHSRLLHSMTPDALLACGLLVEELMKAST